MDKEQIHIPRAESGEFALGPGGFGTPVTIGEAEAVTLLLSGGRRFDHAYHTFIMRWLVARVKDLEDEIREADAALAPIKLTPDRDMQE